MLLSPTSAHLGEWVMMTDKGTYNKEALRSSLWQLINKAQQDGMDKETVEEVMEDMAEGVKYYYEHNSRQAMIQRQELGEEER